MFLSRSSQRAKLAAFVSAAVAVTGLQLALAPSAQAASSDVVINEVYGGGGNAGATYNRDYVELYNPTDASVPLDGTSVQYRSSGGSANPTGSCL